MEYIAFYVQACMLLAHIEKFSQEDIIIAII